MNKEINLEDIILKIVTDKCVALDSEILAKFTDKQLLEYFKFNKE